MAIKTSRHRWQITHTNGILILFGIPFFLMGAFFTGLVLFKSADGTSIGSRLGVCAFTMVFVVIGLSLIGYFSRVIVDVKAGTVTDQWGFFFFPLSSKSFKLDEEPVVHVYKVLRRTSSRSGSGSTTTRTYYVYPVRVQAEGKAITFDEGKDPFKARQLAENLAKFLGATMADGSSGTTVTREADELDVGIGERLAKQDVAFDWPEPPPSMINRVEQSIARNDTSVQLRFPSLAGRFLVPSLVIAVVLLVVAAYLGLRVYRSIAYANTSGDPLRAFYPLAFPAIIAISAAKPLVRALMATRLVIAGDTVEVVRSVLVFSRRTVLNAGEIEEVSQRHGQLALVTDRGIITALHHAPDEEADYCKAVLEYLLAQPHKEGF